MRRFLMPVLALFATMSQAAAPEFAPVTPGRLLTFPADFGAHPDFRTEWWYVTGWLNTPDGKPLGFQVTFFRSRTENDSDNPSAFAAKQLIIGHAALSDPAVGHLVHDQRIARQSFGLAYARTGATDIRLDDWTMLRDPQGKYHVNVHTGALAFDLTLTPTQPVLLEGDAGYSQKGPQAGHASYYYSEPQLQVQGEVSRPGSATKKVTGSAWLDHEWSSQVLDTNAAGWDWVGANLDDGAALMAFQIRAKDGGKLWAHATLRERGGRTTQYDADQVSFMPQARWTSPRTGASYPVAPLLTTGATHWKLDPLQPDQELDSRRSTGAVYWEGAVTAEGSDPKGGRRPGRGYLELTGYFEAIKL
jgi:predicted secreted hydrolase